jgi:hypothetical protein
MEERVRETEEGREREEEREKRRTDREREKEAGRRLTGFWATLGFLVHNIQPKTLLVISK